jgi:hypothetical protein
MPKGIDRFTVGQGIDYMLKKGLLTHIVDYKKGEQYLLD